MVASRQLGLVVFVALSATYRAQPVARAATLGGVRGYVQVVDTTFTWLAQGAIQRVDLPFQSVLCGTPVGDEFLVCGRRAEGGTTVVRVSLDQPAQQLSARRVVDLDGMLVRSVQYASETDLLFLLEEPSGAVHATTPWRLSRPELGNPIGFYPGRWRFAWSDGKGLCIGWRESGYIRIFRSGALWQTETVEAHGDPEPSVAAVGGLTPSGPVTIRVDAAGALSLESTAPSVILLGNARVGTSRYDLPTGVRLSLFDKYWPVLRVGDKALMGHWAFPSLRDGRTMPFGSLSAPIGIQGNADHCYVGSGFLVIGSTVHVANVPMDVEVYVWTQIGTEGRFPTVRHRGITWLEAGAGLRIPQRIDRTSGAELGVPLLLPSDKQLVGRVLYAQMCVMAEDGAVVSDVIGLGIRATPGGRISIPPSDVTREFTRRHAIGAQEVAGLLPRVERLRQGR